MALQSTVNNYFAAAVAGDPVNPTELVFSALNPIAENDLEAGCFAFKGTDPLKQVKNTGTEIAGFVMRVLAYQNTDLTSSASMKVATGEAVSLAVRGHFYATAAAEISAGDTIFAKKGDGKIYSFDAGSSQDGYVETNYVALTGGDVGDTIVISNWDAVKTIVQVTTPPSAV